LEPQIVCVTLKFSEARPYFLPSIARRLKGENKRRVTNVKGAERISFSVRHAAFLLLWRFYKESGAGSVSDLPIDQQA
jgi:hypothetical protein